MSKHSKAAAATLVALLEHEPASTAWLQDELGLSSFAFGRALGEARFRGLITVTDGKVDVTDKAREMLRANRRALDADQATG